LLLQLYLHFPFCKRKCFYCDFCSAAAGEETVAAYCAALENEMLQMGRRFPEARVSTVFLGGGTPTLVPPALMGRVLDTLHRAFVILPDAEFTSEGNPGTLTPAWLDAVMGRGLNRLSLGVQAVQDDLLRSIGRIHTAREARDAVTMARAHGVGNLNLDVMSGLPGQTCEMYLQTLQTVAEWGPEHVSAYSLILEEGTRLWSDVQGGRVSLPAEEETARMYEQGIDCLRARGYERYEISNFARPGYACRHNLGYWQGEWYLGLGVAAHSMLPPSAEERRAGAVRVRCAHGTDIDAYIRGEELPRREPVGVREAMFETLMLELRTTAGVDGKRFARLHGQSLQNAYGRRLDELAAMGLGTWTREGFALTPRGLEVQNEALLRLMD